MRAKYFSTFFGVLYVLRSCLLIFQRTPFLHDVFRRPKHQLFGVHEKINSIAKPFRHIEVGPGFSPSNKIGIVYVIIRYSGRKKKTIKSILLSFHEFLSDRLHIYRVNR